MDEIVITKILEWYYSPDSDERNDREDIKSVFSQLDLERRIVEHSKEIKASELFNNIDSVIKVLSNCRKQGYVTLEQNWIGYEDNYFTVIKKEKENDEEYYRRLAFEAEDFVRLKIQKEKEKQIKIDKIKELQEEIQKLTLELWKIRQ